MKVIIIGTLSDVFHKSFIGKDNSSVDYDKVEIFDSEAFNDSNRHFSIGILSDLVKKMKLLDKDVISKLRGKDFEFLCQGQPDKYGMFKLKCIDIIPVDKKVSE